MPSVPVSSITTAPTLAEVAAYGKLPFDRFVLVMFTPPFSCEKFLYQGL